MTPEAQRFAIATACGWKEVQPPFEFKWMNPETKWSQPDLPDYLNDFNAMHDAIASLDKVQKWIMFCHLSEIVDASIPCSFGTSAEYAKAFLRTLKLWTE